MVRLMFWMSPACLQRTLVSISLLSALFLSSACSTIYFHNGSAQEKIPEEGGIHHIGILGFVEFSKPVDLKSSCSGSDRWHSVKTQNTVLTGAMGKLTNGMYSPWDIDISCK